MAAPVWVRNQSSTTGASATSTFTPTLPTGMTVGNLMLMFVWVSQASPPTVNTPSGWTQVVNGTTLFGSGSGCRSYVFSKIVGASETAPTITLSTTSVAWLVQISEYSGAGSTVAAVAGSTSSGTSVAVPAITTTTADNLIVYADFSNTDFDEITASPTGATLRVHVQNSGFGSYVAVADVAQATAATVSASSFTRNHTQFPCIAHSLAIPAPVTVAPVADFTGTPTSGTEPLSVVFTDTSTLTPTSWAWTFGDGGTSTSQNPSHSYTTAGTYTVALVATNGAGSNTKTRTGYVVVSDQPRPIRINTSQGWADIGDATSFVSGTSTPTSAVGATGAVYLNTATGLFYGPKAGGAWPGTPVPATAPAIPYGTSLPASPADGQEAILVDSVTSPSYQWRFRYNAGSSSTYKWELVGGAPAWSRVATSETTSAGSNADLATVGPQITVPRAGDYHLSVCANVGNTASGAYAIADCVLTPSTSMLVIDAVMGSAGAEYSVASARMCPALAAGGVLKMMYRTGLGGTAAFSLRMMAVLPARVS